MAEPLVLHALRNKRAELSGEVIRAEKEVARLRAGLASLDVTILLFDPTAKPATIKPRQKRTGPNRFRAGEFSRAVLAVLRSFDMPLTVREIAAKVADGTGLDSPPQPRWTKPSRACAPRWPGPREGLVCEKVGKVPMRWRTDGPLSSP